MGFLFSLSCILAYQLTGSDVGAVDNYRLIIDCFLNLPLLFRVSEIAGDEKYAEVAKKHIKTASECLLRENMVSIVKARRTPRSVSGLRWRSA